MTVTIDDALAHLKPRKDCQTAYNELQKLKTHDELRQERKKPPLGLVPKKMHSRQRAIYIIQAMARYNAAGRPIPNEWFEEIYDLL